MPGRFVQERVNGTGPGLRVTDRITARQHDAGQDAVADASLARRRPDDALVIPQSEVAQRILVTVPLQQLPDPLGVRGAETAACLGRTQEHQQREEQGKHPEPAHHEAEVIVPRLGDEPRRTGEAGHIGDDGVDPLRQRVVPREPADHRQCDQADDEVGDEQAAQHPERAPARAPVADRVELAPITVQRDQQGGRDGRFQRVQL